MAAIDSTAKFQAEYPDFRDFLAEVWAYLMLPEPSWIQNDIARTLQIAPKRFILEAFRGIGKSWMTVAFVCWLLGTNPDWKILVVSASKSLADEFSTFCLRLIREMPNLTWLSPDDEGRDSKIAFDVKPARPDKAPSVKSLGIGSQLTGSRADYIICDDCEIPSNSLTPGMREKLSEQVKEFDAILKPEPHCRVVFLGTPQTEDSIYNKLQARGYICRIWPARYPDASEREEYGTRLAPAIAARLEAAHDQLVGSPTDADRFTELDLRERALSYGKAGFARQFQLRTRLSDAERYPIKIHDLMVMDCDKEKAPEKVVWCNDPAFLLNIANNLAMAGDFFYRPMALVGQWIDYTGIVMTIDPAGRGKDETGYAVVAMLNGYLYVLACGGMQGGYEEHVLTALAEIAKKYRVKQILIEANFGDGMYTSLFKPVLAKSWDVTVEEVKHSVQKEKRLCDSLEPVFAQKRVVLDTSLIDYDYKSLTQYSGETAYQYSLIHQLTRLTREKGALVHDDRADALSMAFMYWTELLAADADTEQRDYRAMALDKELEKFMDDTLGIKEGSSTPLWSTHMR
jgi:hypothetical protein